MKKRKPWSGLGLPDKPHEYAPDCTKLLRVENEYFCGGAVFERKESVWRLVDYAPILKWMKGLPLWKIKNELLRRGCKWEWM